MFRPLFFAIAVFLLAPAHAAQQVDNVRELKRAVRNANDGETIVLAAGAYDIADLKIADDLTLRGDGQVVLHSSRPVAKGLLNPLPGVSLTVENLTFRGARSPDLNGAGIRNDGRHLTIIDCVFDENENGVLSTGDRDGVISIVASQFLHNGHGDGYSHGIYVLRASKVDIADSEFIGSRIGHHIKSLADETKVANSTLDDADGETSYAVDLSKGGRVLITGNTIIQSDDASNLTMINYDTSRGGKARSLEIIGNKIVNRRRGGRFLRNDTKLKPVIFDNEIKIENNARLEYEEFLPKN